MTHVSLERSKKCKLMFVKAQCGSRYLKFWEKFFLNVLENPQPLQGSNGAWAFAIEFTRILNLSLVSLKALFLGIFVIQSTKYLGLYIPCLKRFLVWCIWVEKHIKYHLVPKRSLFP